MHKISHFLRYPRTSEKRTTYSLLPPISHPIESRVRSLPFRFARREEEVDVGRDEGAEVRGRRAEGGGYEERREIRSFNLSLCRNGTKNFPCEFHFHGCQNKRNIFPQRFTLRFQGTVTRREYL